MKKPLLLASVFVIVLSATALAQTSANIASSRTAAETRAVYVHFLDASRDRKQAELEQLMTDDYRQVLASGRIRTRSTRLTETLSDIGRITKLQLVDFAPRQYGDTVIAVCKVFESYIDDKNMVTNLDIISTAVFVRVGRNWRIAETHLSANPAK